MGSDNGFPKVATAFNGTNLYAAAVWLSSDGMHTTVQAATGSRTPVAPPTNLMVVQNSTDFGVFKDYYNTISWTASVSGSVIDYVIYRNGSIFNVVNSFTTSIVDHSEIQNGSVTYGVAAVDSDLSQSATVNVNFP
jgi:hypothetical protein